MEFDLLSLRKAAIRSMRGKKAIAAAAAAAAEAAHVDAEETKKLSWAAWLKRLVAAAGNHMLENG